jgi:hypothetical protein
MSSCEAAYDMRTQLGAPKASPDTNATYIWIKVYSYMNIYVCIHMNIYLYIFIYIYAIRGAEGITWNQCHLDI